MASKFGANNVHCGVPRAEDASRSHRMRNGQQSAVTVTITPASERWMSAIQKAMEKAIEKASEKATEEAKEKAAEKTTEKAIHKAIQKTIQFAA